MFLRHQYIRTDICWVGQERVKTAPILRTVFSIFSYDQPLTHHDQLTSSTQVTTRMDGKVASESNELNTPMSYEITEVRKHVYKDREM